MGMMIMISSEHVLELQSMVGVGRNASWGGSGQAHAWYETYNQPINLKLG